MFVIAVMTWGVGLYGVTTVLAVLKATHGWSTAALSAAVTLHYLTSAALVLLLARAHRVVGIARVTQLAAAVMALGIVAWAHVEEPWHLVLAAMLTGIGWAGTGTAAITAMVSAWFEEERAKALGWAMNGISVGGLLFAPAWPAMIGSVGMSTAAIAIGVTACCIIWVLASVFLTTRGPYDPIWVRPSASAVTPPREPILATWRYQSAALSFGIGIVAAMGILIHLTAYLAELWGLMAAGLAVSLVTLSTIVGRSVLARHLHRLGLRPAAAICFLTSATGSALLTAATFPELVVAGCIMFGLGGGGLNFLPALFAQKEFKARETPAVVGYYSATAQLAVAVAPVALGALADRMGTYRGPLIAAALLQLSAVALILSYRHRDAAL